MAKRLKLRMSRVMTSLQTCRSKDPSTLPSDPVPSFLRHTEPPPEFKWRKDDKWHVVVAGKSHDDTPRRKIYNSSASPSGHSSDEDLFFPPASQKKLRTRQRKKTAQGVRLRLSTSSSALLFSSSSEAEELETLVSSTSRSISTSTDSSENIPVGPVLPRRKKKKKKRGERSGGGEWSPARVSTVLRRMMPSYCGVMAVEGKVKESYAVVKRSEDPKEDFKKSMAEMVVEKEMFEEGELEQMLQCFLSLNSRNHQGVIVEAFSEIWEALFTAPSSRRVCSAATGIC